VDCRQTDKAGVSGKNQSAQDRTLERSAQTLVTVAAQTHRCRNETTDFDGAHPEPH
jgi:hypothetical protein